MAAFKRVMKMPNNLPTTCNLSEFNFMLLPVFWCTFSLSKLVSVFNSISVFIEVELEIQTTKTCERPPAL